MSSNADGCIAGGGQSPRMRPALPEKGPQRPPVAAWSLDPYQSRLAPADRFRAPTVAHGGSAAPPRPAEASPAALAGHLPGPS